MSKLKASILEDRLSGNQIPISEVISKSNDRVIKVASISDLEGMTGTEGMQVSVAGYYTDSTRGSGLFIWTTGRHDGGNFIDHNRTFPTDWTNSTQLDAWFADSGVDVSGWRRLSIWTANRIVDFGAVQDDVNYSLANTKIFYKLEVLSDIKKTDIEIPAGVTHHDGLRFTKKNISIRGVTTERAYDDTAVKASELRSTSLFNIIQDTSAQYFTLKDVTLNGDNSTKYGFISAINGSLLERVTVHRHEYGITQAASGNQNIYRDCTILKNSKIGFSILNAASLAWTMPDITFSGLIVRSTIVQIEDCNIRENGFGLLVSEGRYIRVSGTVIESSQQAGFVGLRQNTGQPVGPVVFYNCWFENNYDGFVAGDEGQGTYSIDGIDYFKIDATTYMDWTDADDTGYQILVKSHHTTSNFDKILLEYSEVAPAGQYGVRISKCDGFSVSECIFSGDAISNPKFYSIDSDVLFESDNTLGLIGITPNAFTSIRLLGTAGYGDAPGLEAREGTVFKARGFAFEKDVVKDYSAYNNGKNVLNYYEGKGTFTPVLEDVSGNQATLSAEYGFYTRIGNVVTVHITFNITSLAGMSGRVFVKGLPPIIAAMAGFNQQVINHSAFPSPLVANSNVAMMIAGNAIYGKYGANLDTNDLSVSDLTTGYMSLTGTYLVD